MKNRFLLAAVMVMMALFARQTTFAAAGDLFISEYVEGSSFNKAIEIYNGTGAAVDLGAGNYALELYSNGSASVSQSMSLSGTIADGDVYVVAHTGADAAILAVADTTNGSVINFNGDDAVVLRKGGVVIDAFGQVGTDPGTEWTGGGADDTLRRKVAICAGDTNAADAFDASVEWDSFPSNTFGGLGSHTATCGDVSLDDPVINEFSASTAGTDVEYVEIFGTPNGDYSAYTILEIEGDSGSAVGAVDEVISVGTTDANGLWLGNLPANALENGTISLLLVQDFTGAAGNDLDTNDDGTFDVTPWSAVIDTVAVSDGGASDVTYGVPTLGPNYDGVSSFAPGGASRIPDGFDTDATTDWVRNDFDLAGIPSFTGTPDQGEAFNTPGAFNAVVPPPFLINEVDSDTPGTDTAEFVELYGEPNTALDGLVVVFFNGSSDTSYEAFDLDGYTTDAAGYFVLGNPGVPNVDLVFLPGASGALQNGADAVALYSGDAADFPSSTAVTTSDLIDALVYDTADADDAGLLVLLNAGQPQVDEAGGGNSAGQSNQRCPNASGGARNTDTYAQFAPTPGTENTCGSSQTQGAFIHEVQGSGSAVAINGTVVVTATVVGDYQANDQLSGFFIQEEDADVDGDANTSEGIFVYCGGCAVDVAVGDQVEVTGLAEEFFGMSQIDATETGGMVAVLSSDNALPTPASIDLPASGSTIAAATFENIEGMLVTFTDELVVSEYFELARYGQLVLTADARPAQFTDANEPSVSGYNTFLDDLRSKRIILDDDNNIQNDAVVGTPDEPYFWPRPGLSNTNFVRGGDSITNLTGILHWSFAGQSGTDAWRVRPVEEAFNYDFTTNNERTAAPDPVGGSLKVASFNVLNYFTTLDSRGADSLAELDRQRAKTAAAICAMDADIVGLIEIENNGTVALEDLLNGADGINANCGPYSYVNTGVIGTDEIVVAFIYRTATVSTVGDFAVLDSSVDPRFIDTLNRPALAQTFQESASGGALTVVVNHLKSKGSSCNSVGDPDMGDGAGNCNGTRTQAAAAMVDWLATDPTGSGDPDFLIIGDLNSYRNEDPIDTLELGADDTAGTSDDYTDLLDALIGADAYTYVFDGQLGYLDHALANNTLFTQVTGVIPWHINADEIPVFDYNDEILDTGEASFERESNALPIYAPHPYRASDHDPVIIGLELNGPPVCTAAAPSIASIWPPNHEMVNISILGITDPEGDTTTITIDSIYQDEVVNGDDDGDTAPDGAGIGTSTAQVRAERDGEGNGRVYHVYFTATDTVGNSCSGEVLVSVNVGKNTPAVDDGPLFDSTILP